MSDKSLKERLEAQKREVAQVFEQMLGIEDALDYLRRERLAEDAEAQNAPGRATPPAPQHRRRGDELHSAED